MYTRQEIFDIVGIHLLTQNAKSEGYDPSCGETGCLYRGGYGRKCAAGVLIPDEEYKPEMEGKICILSPVRPAMVNVADNDVLFVRLLQGIHDQSKVEEWKARLLDLANEENLDNTKIKEFKRE